LCIEKFGKIALFEALKIWSVNGHLSVSSHIRLSNRYIYKL